jgi:hypothetical protein
MHVRRLRTVQRVRIIIPVAEIVYNLLIYVL